MRASILACSLLLSGCGCGVVADPWHEPVKVTVIDVHDGDTFTFDPPLDVEGTDFDRVRLACIDAPEVDPDECWGEEARDWLAEKILDKQVTLLFEAEPDITYDRVVATVRHGLTNLNVDLAREGLVRAYEDGYFDQHACCDEVKAAQERAFDAGRGAWGACDDDHWDEDLD